ncbi:hypothetical protein [Desulforamulus ferrireducens]|nr:hypothetical protein [Desulforamulus ferrireducens]
MKKELTPEQAKVAKAIRVMAKIALRILAEQKNNSAKPGEHSSSPSDKS